MSKIVLFAVQVAVETSCAKEDSLEQTVGRVQREYFERCVAVVSAALKFTDNATMLTCATEPYHPGTSTTAPQNTHT